MAANDNTFLQGVPNGEEYLVRIPFDVATAGTYRIFLRASSTGGGDNSIWFRVAGSKWYKWNGIN